MDAHLPEHKKRGLFAGVPVIIGCVALLAFVGVALLSRSYGASIASCRAMVAQIEGLEFISQQELAFLQTNGELVSHYHSTLDARAAEISINGAYGRLLRERIDQGGPTAIRGLAPAANFTTAPSVIGGTDIRLVCP